MCLDLDDIGASAPAAVCSTPHLHQERVEENEDDILQVIVQMTNLETQHIHGESWKSVDITESTGYIGLFLLAGAFHEQGESVCIRLTCTPGPQTRQASSHPECLEQVGGAAPSRL
ncbi:uncharacterized protein V6R79_004113 [Siganus canaliculatus]